MGEGVGEDGEVMIHYYDSLLSYWVAKSFISICCEGRVALYILGRSR